MPTLIAAPMYYEEPPDQRGAMMDELVRLADALRPRLMSLLTSLISRSRVQGALLELDRYWYLSAANEVFRRENMAMPPPPNTDIMNWLHRELTFRQLSLNWNYRPPDWAEHCKTMGYVSYASDTVEGSQPVIVRVILRDPAEARQMESSPEPLQDLFVEGLTLPRYLDNYPILYELRPPAVASAGAFQVLVGTILGYGRPTKHSRVSVGRADPNTSGTLGGYLRDPNSDRRFLVSCSHVLGPFGTEVYCPGPFEGKRSEPIGVVRFSAVSPVRQSDVACSFDAFPMAGRVDVAVAELYPGYQNITAGPDRIRRIAQLPPFLPVTFTGKETGFVEAQINHVTVWQDLFTQSFGDGPAGFRCYRIFELSGRRGDLGVIAREGDSGAWITDEVSGLKSWVGVIVGTQGVRAYGCFAEHVMEAIQTESSLPKALALGI